ncbi:hypothetical protein [Paraburkholderia sp. HP33-1]|uniref:hypothetical protein n=1 Tax=Paraburkholderia sp. HP33-1 TaxID=2883243 RepID=UPI001F288B6F|nr:hypothetical protein [Paraburkholderia sp. HP33-1]
MRFHLMLEGREHDVTDNFSVRRDKYKRFAQLLLLQPFYEFKRRGRQSNAVRSFCFHPFAWNGPDACFEVELIPYRAANFAASRRRQYQEQQGGARGSTLFEFGSPSFSPSPNGG